MNNTNKDIAVHIISHDDMDGLFGLSLALKALKDVYNNITYEVLNHGYSFDKKILDKDKLILIDFSLKKEEFLICQKKGIEIIVLDHHYSIYETLRELRISENFRLDKCGAKIVYDYFFKKKNNHIEKIINLVNDYDLGILKNRDSIMLNLGFMKQMKNITKQYDGKTSLKEKIDFTSSLLEENDLYLKLIEDGKKIDENTKEDFLKLEEKSCETRIITINNKEYKMRVVVGKMLNPSYMEIDHADYDGYIVVYKKKGSERIHVSVYATPTAIKKNEDIDLSVISTKYGGGGHKRASGFIVDSIEELPFELTYKQKQLLT